MKCFKLLLVILILTITTPTNAQKKGDMYTGGKLGLSFYSFDGEGLTSFAIAPEFGYFVTKNLKIGASLEYSVTLSTHIFTVNPNVAYHVPITDKLSYTPQVNIGGGLGTYDGYKSGVFGFSLNFASFEYKPTNKFGITASLINFDYAYIDELHIASFYLLSSPTIGFRYYF